MGNGSSEATGDSVPPKDKLSWIERITGSDGKRKRRPIEVPKTAEDDLKEFQKLLPTEFYMQRVWVPFNDRFKPSAVYHYCQSCADPVRFHANRVPLQDMVDMKCIPCTKCYPAGRELSDDARTDDICLPDYEPTGVVAVPKMPETAAEDYEYFRAAYPEGTATKYVWTAKSYPLNAVYHHRKGCGDSEFRWRILAMVKHHCTPCPQCYPYVCVRAEAQRALRIAAHFKLCVGLGLVCHRPMKGAATAAAAGKEAQQQRAVSKKTL